MQLHQIQRHTPNKRSKRVGRGGIRGKTSGRGTKGQKARSGHRIRPDVREKLKKFPKLRGRGRAALKSIGQKATAINVSVLEHLFSGEETITPQVLFERGIISVRKGTHLKVKILASGELTKKLTIEGCLFSQSAKEKIERAGGSITS